MKALQIYINQGKEAALAAGIYECGYGTDRT